MFHPKEGEHSYGKTSTIDIDMIDFFAGLVFFMLVQRGRGICIILALGHGVMGGVVEAQN